MRSMLLVFVFGLAAQTAHAGPSLKGTVLAYSDTLKTPKKTIADGYLEGRRVAELATSKGAPGLGGGLVAGLLGGIIGTAIVYSLTEGDDPDIITLSNYEGESADFKLGFRQAYRETYKEKKKKQRLGGGLLGTVILVVVYLQTAS
ncbi:MAG: hypothetical protein F4Z57_18485 [Gemmatimonadetes bacterium]|nr:hypothetical protein [Gemmatimonadota bacterium]MXW80929.1 hypothetical protein [Gemmatimonadota bacterium]MYC73172.1 hypothetical protein [Gemmatimonadota bacterium]